MSYPCNYTDHPYHLHRGKTIYLVNLRWDSKRKSWVYMCPVCPRKEYSSHCC